MAIALKFNDEFGGGTGEVGNIRADGMLAAKAEALELVVAEEFPESPLIRSLLATEFAGAFGVAMDWQ